MKVLVVTSPFGGHEVGHRVTDGGEIRDILGGEHANKVVQADHDMQPAAAPETTDNTQEA